MAPQLLSILVCVAVLTKADIHDDFPQWDRIHWLVDSTNRIELKCEHPEYFPFNSLDSMLNVQWILPEHTSYMHILPNTSNEGWRMLGKEQKYTLMINKDGMNVPEAVDGQYVCAALAKANPNATDNTVLSWYYLRWGVGLYTNVPAMKSGSIAHKYYWCFTYAWVSLLVVVVIMILFAATVHFRYKGGPTVTYEGSDEDSVTLTENVKDELTSLEKKDDSTFKL